MASLTTFPPEVLLHIISYLPHIHHLYAVSLSCRRLHGLAERQLYLLAARKHPYLLCWACGTGDARLVERLLDAGVDPNRPVRMPRAIYDERDWTYCLTHSTPMEALEFVYTHFRWITAYSNARERTWLGRRGNDDVINDPEKSDGQFTSDPETTTSDCYDYDYLSSVDKAYDPGNHPDLLAYLDWGSYWFPIHAAALIGCDTIVRLLLERGAHINAPAYGLCYCKHCLTAELRDVTWDRDDDTGYSRASTPIHIAMCHDQISTVCLLISIGSTITTDLRCPESTIFHTAASRGNVFIMKLLLNKQLASIDAHDHFGLTPLLHALHGHHGERNSISVIRWLLKHGADVNYSFKHGCTPLHVACSYGWYKEADELIKSGASVDTPCRRALRQGSSFMSSDGFLPITWACTDYKGSDLVWCNEEDEEVVNAPVHVHNGNSYSGYNEAVERHAIRTVRALLDAGSNNPRCTSELQIALLAATTAHRTWLMELLVEAGADVSGVTDMGYRFVFSPLLVAVKSWTPTQREVKPTETMRWLLERGANINQVVAQGDSIFYHINGALGIEMLRSIEDLLQEQGLEEPD